MEKQAVLITESSDLLFFVRDKLRPLGWSIASLPVELAAIEAHVRRHPISALLLDDTPENPSVIWAKALWFHPLLAGYPIIPLLLEAHKGDRKIFTDLGIQHVIQKPVSSDDFTSTWKEWESAWQSSNCQRLHRSVADFSAGNFSQAGAELKSLEKEGALPIALQHVPAYKLLLQKDLQAAEKDLLLRAKKEKTLSLALATAEFYLQVQLPHFALQFLQTLESKMAPAQFLLPSLVQAHILLGNYEAAILHLEKNTKINYFRAASLTVLGHLLYARSRREEANRMLQEDSAAYSKLKRTWSQMLGHS